MDPELGDAITADDIPEPMVRVLVHFAQDKKLQPQHLLRRREEKLPKSTWEKVLGPSTPHRVKVHYDAEQSSQLPPTASIIELSGNERCVPTVKVLAYTLPLQLRVCYLIAPFRVGWPPEEEDLFTLKGGYKIVNADSGDEAVSELVENSTKAMLTALKEHVSHRVNALQAELELE